MNGQINLKKKMYAKDMSPIDSDCDCNTCQNYTRAYLHGVVTDLPVACHLLTEHNLAFQLRYKSWFENDFAFILTSNFRLMKTIRKNVIEGTFVDFVQKFMLGIHPDKKYPSWIRDSLAAVNISLL